MSTDNATWFVKDENGRCFGPADWQAIVAWSEDNRIGPAHLLSADQKNWRPARDFRELGMTWYVELGPDNVYGPLPRKAIENLVSEGTVPADARIFERPSTAVEELRQHFTELAAACDRLKSEGVRQKSEYDKLQDERDRLKAECEELVAKRDAQKEEFQTLQDRNKQLDAECEQLRKERQQLADECQKLTDDGSAQKALCDSLQNECAELKEETQKLRDELARLTASLASKNDEIAAFNAELAEIRSSIAQTQIIEPEVVCDAPRPNGAAEREAPAAAAPERLTLADLESQARRELASLRARGQNLSSLFGKKGRS